MCEGIGVIWGISFSVMLLLDKVSDESMSCLEKGYVSCCSSSV